MPGWQALYQELKDSGFEIVAAAQDTGGKEAAGPFYDAAGATFTTLLDPNHTVSELYHMVNVPNGVWIDEQGRIVRPPEVAWSHEMDFGSMKAGDERYIEGLRDWVAKGADSIFVMDSAERARRLAPRNTDRPLADAHFRLAVHLHDIGQAEAAKKQWEAAQALAPDNWNAHRQAWVFEPEQDRRRKFSEKYGALGDRPYYEPLDLPGG